MGILLHNLALWFERLAETTMQASLLCVLILLAQQVMRGGRFGRWRYGLWLLLVVRLILPWTPQSRVSVFNLIPSVGDRAAAVWKVPEAPMAGGDQAISATSATSDEEMTRSPGAEKITRSRKARHFSIGEIAGLVWLAGAVVLAAIIGWSNYQLWRGVRGERPVTERWILDLLEACKELIGVRTMLAVVATDRVKSPSLFGFVRPRLLLPLEMLATIEPSKLRYVFLHEISHLKRNDIAMGWLMSALQVLHWFNPLMWLAFWRMREDREVACDATALAHLREGEAHHYGRTIVEMLERFCRRQRLPITAGILENTAQLKRRMTMIAGYKKSTVGTGVLALAAMAVLAAVTLTNAVEPAGGQAQPQAVISSTSENTFVDDPAVIGVWKSVDLVEKIEDFKPGQNQRREELNYLIFEPGGKIAQMEGFMTWTKGRIHIDRENKVFKYEIREISGTRYLFLIQADEEKGYIVLRSSTQDEVKSEPMMGKAADVPSDSTIDEKGWIVDKVDYPFIDDPAVIGAWKSVDFVKEPGDFKPGEHKWRGELFLKHLIFEPGGKLAQMNGLATWTKGLVLYSNDTKTASRYIIQDINGVKYLFYEWKSGDYTIRHQKPSYYVLQQATRDSVALEATLGETAELMPDSTIDKNGRIVDKIDFPFVDDPAVIGRWKGVDFVDKAEQFNPKNLKWKRDLFLKDLVFLPNGRMKQPWYTWTKGIVCHSGDRTASHYVIREIDGATYLFFEWKSGDYIIRHTKPQFYVLKKESSDTSGLADAWADQPSDMDFRQTFPAKLARLNIDTAGRNDIVAIFGEPGQYVWGRDNFTKDNLPQRYCMFYPDRFSIFMMNDKIVELRYEHPGYFYRDKLQVGSTLEDVIAVVGEPTETVQGKKNEFKDGVLYKNTDGRAGSAYYALRDQHVRFFFQDDKVTALYMTRE
jgi:bla regulator protein blaR1